MTSRPRLLRVICAHCHREFSAANRKARFCSGSCRAKASQKGILPGVAQQAARPKADPPTVLPGPQAELAGRVLSMRLAGASYEAIARAVDAVDDAGHATKLAELGLQAVQNLSGWESQHRPGMEHAKLDLAERNCIAVLQNAASGGDPQLVLAAVDRLLRVSQARLALDGRETAVPADEDPLQKAMASMKARLSLVTQQP